MPSIICPSFVLDDGSMSLGFDSRGLRSRSTSTSLDFGCVSALESDGFDSLFASAFASLALRLAARRSASPTPWTSPRRGSAPAAMRVLAVVGEVEPGTLEHESGARRQLPRRDLAALRTRDLGHGIAHLAIEALELVSVGTTKLVSWHLAKT